MGKDYAEKRRAMMNEGWSASQIESIFDAKLKEISRLSGRMSVLMEASRQKQDACVWNILIRNCDILGRTQEELQRISDQLEFYLNNKNPHEGVDG